MSSINKNDTAYMHHPKEVIDFAYKLVDEYVKHDIAQGQWPGGKEESSGSVVDDQALYGESD